MINTHTKNWCIAHLSLQGCYVLALFIVLALCQTFIAGLILAIYAIFEAWRLLSNIDSYVKGSPINPTKPHTAEIIHRFDDYSVVIYQRPVRYEFRNTYATASAAEQAYKEFVEDQKRIAKRATKKVVCVIVSTK